jgi:hypothetical protein
MVEIILHLHNFSKNDGYDDSATIPLQCFLRNASPGWIGHASLSTATRGSDPANAAAEALKRATEVFDV